MDIDRLRYFYVLTKSASMSEASKLLRISQPALSKAIKTLESELNTKLILPSGRGISITKEGEKIAVRAASILEQLNRISDFSAESEPKTVKIGSFEVFSTYFIGHLIDTHLKDAGVQLYELIPGEIEEQLVARHIDIGITYLPIPNRQLDFVKAAEIEMSVYGRKEKFGKTAFADLPFVIPAAPIRDTPTKIRGLDGWPDDRIPRKVTHQVTLMESALELCRRGLAVAYLPKFIVTLHNEHTKPAQCLAELSIPAKLRVKQQPVYVVKRKSDAESSHFRKIAMCLRNISKATRV